MLEIIAIIYLSRKIGDLAEQKGLRKGTWRLYMVLGWIGSEIAGAILGVITFGPDNLLPTMLVAYALAVSSYFLIKSILDKKPDVNNDSFDFEK